MCPTGPTIGTGQCVPNIAPGTGAPGTARAKYLRDEGRSGRPVPRGTLGRRPPPNQPDTIPTPRPGLGRPGGARSPHPAAADEPAWSSPGHVGDDPARAARYPAGYGRTEERSVRAERRVGSHLPRTALKPYPTAPNLLGVCRCRRFGPRHGRIRVGSAGHVGSVRLAGVGTRRRRPYLWLAVRPDRHLPCARNEGALRPVHCVPAAVYESPDPGAELGGIGASARGGCGSTKLSPGCRHDGPGVNGRGHRASGPGGRCGGWRGCAPRLPAAVPVG